MSLSKTLHWFLGALVLAASSTACVFPTHQTASVRQGFHVTAGAAVLGDQTRLVGGRSIKAQGPDYIVFASPSVGFGGAVAVEFGLPLGVYGEDLTGASTGCVMEPCFGWEQPENGERPFALPYVKVGVGQAGADRFAALVGVSGLGAIYSRELGPWEPYVSVRRLFSGGDPQLEDVPRLISRFQESDQSVWAFALGVERRARLATGLLVNDYRGTSPLTDVFVGARLTR